MKLRISKNFAFFSVFFLLAIDIAEAQAIKSYEILMEINHLLKVHCPDRSFFEITEFCGILEEESNNEYYQYILSEIDIKKPQYSDSKHSIFIICLDEKDCIVYYSPIVGPLARIS